MSDLTRLIADLKRTESSKAVLKEVRRTIRRPIPAAREGIKAAALRTLPVRGGLNRWVASTKVTASIALTARRVQVTLKGGRNSARKRSDVNAIDRGRVRHPAWGRRGPGQWSNQTVVPGFFTTTVEQKHAEDFRQAVDEGASIIAERLNRG